MKDLISLPSLSLRTVAALLAVVAFWISLVGIVMGNSPLEQAEALLRWLGIDQNWTGHVASWLGDRAEVTTVLAGLCVVGGVVTVLVVEPKLSVGNVPGAWTALAAVAVLLEVGAGVFSVLGWVAGGAVVGVIVARLAGRTIQESVQAGATELFVGDCPRFAPRISLCGLSQVGASARVP